MKRFSGRVPTEEDHTLLCQVVNRFMDDYASALDVSYSWPIPNDLPVTFERSHASRMDNILLRRAMSDAWVNEPDRRQNLAVWYVAQWGGIRGNKSETIRGYVQTPPDELAARNLNGVATWSKILAMSEPAKYAIFDARVCASMNALQVLQGNALLLFPRLPGRNTKINAFERWLGRKYDRRIQIARPHAYTAYLNVLRTVARQRPSSIEDIEMTLFSNAEVLAEKAMKVTLTHPF
jgi:hypothetical protein